MMRRLLSPLVLALTAFACGKTASTPTPDTEYPMIQIVDCEGSSVEGAPWRKAPREDGLFSHLAERVPGFGGLFPEDGRLAVYLMDLDTADRAQRTLEWFLRREFPELADRAHDIHWLQGQYDWRQLVVWRDCLAGRFFSLMGAVSSGLDEGQNRITFGAPTEERIAVIKMELEKTIVPQEAVIFQRPVTCRLDAEDAKNGPIAILTNPDLEWWLQQVGLSNANPDDLTLVTQDATCQTLWTAISRRDPYPGDRVTFWKLGDRYIITEEPSDDPNDLAVGYRLTTVVDEQFIQQGPTLAD